MLYYFKFLLLGLSIIFGVSNAYGQEESFIDNHFCAKEILFDSLKFSPSYQGYYSVCDKGETLLDKEEINIFCSFTEKVSFYKFSANNEHYIIAIGKALEATGIGVDYWSYLCYDINQDKVILEFPSLINTPYSIFLKEDGTICHVEVDDNYPRPASGEVPELDHYPVFVALFEGDKEMKHVEYKCYSFFYGNDHE